MKQLSNQACFDHNFSTRIRQTTNETTIHHPYSYPLIAAAIPTANQALQCPNTTTTRLRTAALFLFLLRGGSGVVVVDDLWLERGLGVLHLQSMLLVGVHAAF